MRTSRIIASEVENHQKNQNSYRSVGGQPGHTDATLQLSAHPDRVVPHPVLTCRQCGRNLHRQKPVSVERRQVFDLPPIRMEVTDDIGILPRFTGRTIHNFWKPFVPALDTS